MEPKFSVGETINDGMGYYLVLEFEEEGIYTLEDLETGDVSWYPQEYVESTMGYEGDFDIDEVEEMDFSEIHKTFWKNGVDSFDKNDYNE